MHYNYQQLSNYIEWDIVNWGKFLKFIEDNDINFKGKNVLEIGSRNGGLSLYCANKGAFVVCSDLNGPTVNASKLHEVNGVTDLIEYKAIDATNIPHNYDNFFDIVIFKSVLGGIGSYNNYTKQQACVDSIYNCLKKNGKVIFAENMHASQLHTFFRKMSAKSGVEFRNRWHYENEQEIFQLFSKFALLGKKYVGFLGCFGRNEWQRNFLGQIDSAVFDLILPDKWRYIGMYLFEKKI